jgi:hypothetical protein
LATTLLVALLPELTTEHPPGIRGHAPWRRSSRAAAAVALSPHPARPGWRSPLPWLIGGAMTVKQEGGILALIAMRRRIACWAERPRRLAERLRAHRGGLAVVAAFVAIRVTYVPGRARDITWGRSTPSTVACPA